MFEQGQQAYLSSVSRRLVRLITYAIRQIGNDLNSKQEKKTVKQMKSDWSSLGIAQGSSVDTDTIAQVETAICVVFPDSYLDLVKYADESSPELSLFPYGNAVTCISEFFSFSPALKAGTIVWHTRVAGLPAGWVPIARDAGNYLICLNFNTLSTTVEIFDPTSGNTFFVANSFDDFVNLWRE